MPKEIAADSDLRHLYREFNRVCCEFDQLYRTAASRMGLSDSAFQILMAIYDLGEGCTQAQICNYVCLGKQTISSSVKNLKAQGLITLQNKPNVRGASLFLTEEGRRAVEERVSPVIEADVRALSLLGYANAKRMVEISRSYLQGFEGELANVEFASSQDNKDR